MKLKLEPQQDQIFLSISDYITTQHISVLKAGLSRIISGQGKKNLILDFSSMPESGFQPPSVKQEIDGLRDWAAEQAARILIISSIAGWGDASTREGALEILGSQLGQLRDYENKLHSQVSALERSYAEIEAKVKGLAISDSELKTLRRDNGHLKARIAELEGQLRLRLQARIPNYENPSTRAKAEAASRTLVMVLEQEGILPVI